MDKTIQLAEIPSFLAPGRSLAIGGAWLSNHPMAAVRQMLRDGVQDQHLISTLASIEADLLIGGGAVSELTFSMVSLETYGLAPHFRAAAEGGSIRLREMTGVAMNVAFDAGARRLPYLPMRGVGGSEIPLRRREEYREIECPFSGERLLGVRAFEPDVAIIHATRADQKGNAQVDASWGNDPEIARAARRVVVTCEELVEPERIAATPTTTHVPGFLVDAVVEAPFGAHPTSHLPVYVTDGWWLLDYAEACEGGQGAELISALAAESEADYLSRVLAGERSELISHLAGASAPEAR